MNIVEQIKVNDVSIDGYQGTFYTKHLDYVQVTTDSEGKLIEGIKSDGSKYIAGNLIIDGSIYNNSNLHVDEISAKIYENDSAEIYSSDIKNYKHIVIDKDNRFIEAITDEGNKVIFGDITINGLLSNEDLDEKLEDIRNSIHQETFIDISDDGYVLSDFKNEQMTQCPGGCYGKDGYMYISYYSDAYSRGESQSIHTLIKLSKVPVCKLSETQTITVLSAGDTVGDFNQSNKIGPYDSLVFDDGEKIRCIMVCSEYESRAEQRMGIRDINKSDMTLDDEIHLITFSYVYNNSIVEVPMRARELATYVSRRENKADDYYCPGRPMFSQITEYDGYYYTYVGCMKGYQADQRPAHFGFVARTLDMVHWEEVSYPLGFTDSYGNVIEAGLEFGDNGTMYICLRSWHYPIFSIELVDANSKTYSNTWTLSKYTVTASGNEQRPFIYKRHNTELYVVVTGPDELYAKDNTKIIRTNLIIVKYDMSLNEISRKSIISRFGLVYPQIINASEGDYIICAENRRWDYHEQGVTYPCSDIACIPISFLIKM